MDFLKLAKKRYACRKYLSRQVEPEKLALEPMLSRNIIKLQITDNHTQFGIHSKSKSF